MHQSLQLKYGKKVKKSGMNEKDKERCRLAGLRVAWMEWNIHIHSSVPQQMSDLDGALPSVRRKMQLALVLQLYRCVQGPASATMFGSELPGCTVWVTA